MRPQGFPRWLRLRRRLEFLRAQRAGQKLHMRHFLVFVTTREPDAGEITRTAGADALPPTRLGVTVTRKVGHAVVRNRIRRLVREAFRRERHLFAPGYDMVWVAKRNAADVGFSGVVSDLHALAGKLERRATRARPEGS
jgi:ribonuclease P protein component